MQWPSYLPFDYLKNTFKLTWLRGLAYYSFANVIMRAFVKRKLIFHHQLLVQIAIIIESFLVLMEKTLQRKKIVYLCSQKNWTSTNNTWYQTYPSRLVSFVNCCQCNKPKCIFTFNEKLNVEGQKELPICYRSFISCKKNPIKKSFFTVVAKSY